MKILSLVFNYVLRVVTGKLFRWLVVCSDTNIYFSCHHHKYIRGVLLLIIFLQLFTSMCMTVLPICVYVVLHVCLVLVEARRGHLSCYNWN